MVKTQWIFTKNIARLIKYIESVGYVATFGEAYRTIDQQMLYFYGWHVDIADDRIGFLKGKKLSWTMNSNHRKRLAIDLNFFIDGKLTYDKDDLQIIGDFWESLHPKNRWGGNWKTPDTPHFEMQS